MSAAALAPGAVRTLDGLELRLHRQVTAGARATVVLVHGFAASSNDPALRRQASAFVDTGFDVVTYDSRGHGTSEGLCTLGDLEAHDVAAAVAAAQDGRPVVVVGASMGAIAVLRYAAGATAGPAVAGVVAVSCPAAWRAPRSAQGVLATALTRTRLGRRVAHRRMQVRLSPGWSAAEPPTALVGRIRLPLAFVHGQADRFIRASNAVELFRASAQPRRLDLVPGMGHAYDALGVSPIVAAVEWALVAALGAGAAR